MVTEKQKENLIPFNKRTESEQREIRRKGGIKSGEARNIKKAVAWMLSLPVSSKENKDMCSKLGVSSLSTKLTQGDAIVFASVKEARKGNHAQAKMIYEMSGALGNQAQAMAETHLHVHVEKDETKNAIEIIKEKEKQKAQKMLQGQQSDEGNESI